MRNLTGGAKHGYEVWHAVRTYSGCTTSRASRTNGRRRSSDCWKQSCGSERRRSSKRGGTRSPPSVRLPVRVLPVVPTDGVPDPRVPTAFRATLTDKMASLSVDLPPLSPSGGARGPASGSHGDRPLCWGVNGWCTPAQNCPFREDMQQHDELLRQLVAQWG